MKTKDLMELPRKERADRTYQRIVYRKLVDLQIAVSEARQVETPLGVVGELDIQNLIEQLVKLADIDYRSPGEITRKIDENEAKELREKAAEMVENEPVFEGEIDY